ncbi:peroxin 11C like [Fusarium agapanthi]|uniref:Peroxin 11C like n=1 Tax=Fusarium agapanthi TaxID=1803897 RepID=A0A9P5E4A6_9HYPO|nr:peroxin 11C like [Fusarium agapanthi]
MPVQSKIALNAPDRLFFRLNELMKPTRDLGSVLTTFNYGLYLLAYFDSKAYNLKSKALSFVRPETAFTALSTAAEAESSPFARLGSVVANARLTLRLFGLPPIYVQVRKLIRDGKSMDPVLYIISFIQCSLYATFQLLENIAFLTEKGVLMKCGLGWLFNGADQIFFTKNNLEKGEITREEAEKAVQWYYDWIRPLAWLPIGWHLSGWMGETTPGFNLEFKGQRVFWLISEGRLYSGMQTRKPELSPLSRIQDTPRTWSS